MTCPVGLREEEEKKDTEVPQTCLEKGTELGEALECKSDEEQLSKLGGSAGRKEGSGEPSGSAQLPDGRLQPEGVWALLPGNKGKQPQIVPKTFRLDIGKTSSQKGL